jgi:penicillin-binding protein 1A
MIRRILIAILTFSLISSLVAISTAYFFYLKFTSDLPKISKIEDYKPAAVTKVLSADGSLIGEFFKERRYPVKLSEIPNVVRQAVLAAEDASFYTHPGIDFMSIIRAAVKNLESGKSSQGGSTITQQVVKNLLLSPKKTFERKIKEAVLSYQLEGRLTKDDILEIYLNEIYFGNTAYGIKAAAVTYFHKELKDLNLAEGAILAGLPKAPNNYSPVVNLEKAKNRQRYVLNQMVEAGFISQNEADKAYEQEITVYPADGSARFYSAPYFLREVKEQLEKLFPSRDLEVEGATVKTTLDLNAQALAEISVSKGLRAVDKRRGWRGVIANVDPQEYLTKYAPTQEIVPFNLYKALVLKVDKAKSQIKIQVGEREYDMPISLDGWSSVQILKDETKSYGSVINTLKNGDVIEVSFSQKNSEPPVLDQTPLIEGALVSLDPFSGRVVAMVGGYDYNRSEFNRATQSNRQPGSAFKPFVYLAAIDSFGYTPATLVYDEPRTFRVGVDYWSPKNFDGQFLGPITLQTALERSRNVVVADLISKIGANSPIEYARRLGIKSALTPNLSLALGSNEVNLMEITRAYGVFAAQGVLFPTTYIEEVSDRFDKTVYSLVEQLQAAEQVIPEDSAFIMAHMMKGVVSRGTAQRVKVLGRPVAGKTGTTNNQMDAWFIGYTPQWVTGVWVGFDQKKEIGARETGGKVAAPIWIDFMQRFLEIKDNEHQLVNNSLTSKDEDNTTRIPEITKVSDVAKTTIDASDASDNHSSKDFIPPDTVIPYWIDRYTGSQVNPDVPGAILEYFRQGTAPPKYQQYQTESVTSYLEATDL